MEVGYVDAIIEERKKAEEQRKHDEQTKDRSEFVDGFSIEELHKAFDAVCDLDNWKNPIKATVHMSLIDVTLRAIEFMTGTKGTVTGIMSSGRRVWIEAPGYYAGPCN